MLSPEYLTLKFSASRGCRYKDSIEEMFWDDVKLIKTQNDVTTIQTLQGGMAKMEVYVDNYLERYTRQGWQIIRVERPDEKIQGYGKTAWQVEKTVMYMFKRSVTQEQQLVVRKDNAFFFLH